ncbi:MAG: glycosyltransferase, partial [Ignavibacteriae bacterium]|nr:glycosyltransferase [Ignavibacteriota bacterium]
MKQIVIIPTYNEFNNIQKLIPQVLDLYSDLDILIVDDNSPDGTGKYIEEL